MLALATALLVTFPSSDALAIRHVSVIDVINGHVERDTTVLLTNGAIAGVGKTLSTENARVVDGTGKFLIPGLWDMHVHCCDAHNHFFPLFLPNGITGIRDLFGPLEELKTVRTKVENGTIPGPRMVFSGPIVDGPKPVWKGSIAVSTPEEGRKAVETLQQNGADFVKVYSLLPREAYFAIADEARRRQMVFAGHVPDVISAIEASDAGQKSFEHLLSVLAGCSLHGQEIRTAKDRSWQQAISQELAAYDPSRAKTLFATFRRNGTWQCPTLTVLQALSQFDPGAYEHDPRLDYLPGLLAMWTRPNRFGTNLPTANEREIAGQLFNKDCELVKAMEKAGIGILAGTDTPNVGALPGFGIHDELALLVKSGLTPLQALQAATINPARYFGWEKQIGTVTTGKAADLVLLDANPLKDIKNTQRIRAVFVRGRYFDRAALDQMLKTASDTAALTGKSYQGLDWGE